MANLAIYKDDYIEFTAISNYFIDNYMKDANDAQLKVYLYLVRMVHANMAFGVSDIADKFNHTEKDILRALRYWEKQNLLSLEFDAGKNLTAIHLRGLGSGMNCGITTAGGNNMAGNSALPAGGAIAGASAASAGNGTAANATAAGSPAGGSHPVAAGNDALSNPMAMGGETLGNPMAMGNDALGNPMAIDSSTLGNPMTIGSETLGNPAAAEGGNTVTFCQQRQLSLADIEPAREQMTVPGGAGWEAALEEPDPYAKPAYSADQLRSFKEQENTAQLLFVAQVYVGRTLTASDMKTILYLSDVLRFSDDLIDYLIQYCVDRGKKDFRYMEKVAVSWAQQGITTPKQAQKAALKYDKSVYAIMNELGKSSAPTNKELEYINRWTREYGFTPDIIFEACERTVMAVDKHRFEYAEGILSSWRKENVRHKADIKRVDEQHQKQKSAAANTAPRNSAAVSNKFNQFKQNTYNFEELEKELLSN
ncbi:hypothetical protein IMSAGC003_03478 [Lachnospiraceae bacterium]|nr:hypothetical protein IMSAGC003_03478 [Lachnospiraceae bacterium]